MQWHRLDPEKTENLIAAIARIGGPASFTAQNSEAKCMRLPFFEHILLYRITNHTMMPIFQMDFLGNGTDFYYLDGTFAPIQRACTHSALDLDEHNMAAYLQFYFFNVLQEDGEIYPVYERSPIPDLEDQNVHATHADVPEGGYLFEIETEESGSFHVSTCLFYDGGWMIAGLRIKPTGEVEITGLKPLFGHASGAFQSSSKDHF
ncbi:MAG: hypothetical protein AB7E85_09085 [Pseudobdellovibrionaceae bacterium]